jgi:hypothetical protein
VARSPEGCPHRSPVGGDRVAHVGAMGGPVEQSCSVSREYSGQAAGTLSGPPSDVAGILEDIAIDVMVAMSGFLTGNAAI